jgi:crotonobetainyl-CoA:carnitine CoA-transferase CaiB-like acyl-CoA transferase
LPNIAAIAETSRGKRSAVLDLRKSEERDVLRHFSADAHVFVQGYRVGGLAALGFGPAEMAKVSPGIVYVTLSAYGREGPWADRRGFDSLVQTAMGFNRAEGSARREEKCRVRRPCRYSTTPQASLSRQASLPLWCGKHATGEAGT